MSPVKKGSLVTLKAIICATHVILIMLPDYTPTNECVNVYRLICCTCYGGTKSSLPQVDREFNNKPNIKACPPLT